MKTKTKSILAALRSKFMAALPIILFFLFLFYSTILLFGISYSILVSVVTILFKVNYRKSFTVRQLMVLVGTQFLMALLSFFASLSLPLCILLNLIVPFLLVFLQTSQFNQLGYFANAMCFVFLQLRPVGREGLALQMAALAYGLAVLTIVLFFCSLRNKKNDHFSPAKRGLLLLADALRAQIEPKAHATEQGKPSDSPASGQAEPIFPILQGLYGEAYKSRGLTYVVSPRGKIQYMFALLFQRAVYFLTNPYQASMLSDPNRHDLLERLAQYMETAGTDGFEQEELVRTGSELLAEVEECDEIPCIFIQNFLRLFLLILDNIRQDGGKQSSHGWKLPSYRRPLKKLFGQIKADTFETRFALRLSAVLTIGFAYSMISQANHGYWLVLNAFLLLRPMYEESATRIKTRFIGTLAGCLILQLLLPLFHGTGWHFLLATFMAVGLYMETASAMVLVLLVNRFVFPTHQKGQFRYNLYQLFHIHHVYLRLLESSLAAPLDYGVICDVQIHYHLIHDQIIQYLKKAGSEDSAFIKKLLWISWHMISEAEQMLFLINNRKTRTVNSAQLEDYLAFTACILSEIQEMLHMKADRNRTVTPEILYKRTMEGEPRLSMLMEQYSKQLSEMYRCVCGHNG